MARSTEEALLAQASQRALAEFDRFTTHAYAAIWWLETIAMLGYGEADLWRIREHDSKAESCDDDLDQAKQQLTYPLVRQVHESNRVVVRDP